MRQALLLILVLLCAPAITGCTDRSDRPDYVPPPAPVTGEAPGPPPALPAPASCPEPRPAAPAADEIGWDFAQRLLGPLGRSLEYEKLAVEPERLAEIGASDFHAFSISDPGILLYVFEFPTPAAAAARAGSVTVAAQRWGLLDVWDAALNHNLVMAAGITSGDGINDAQRELSEHAAELFGIRVSILRNEIEAAKDRRQVESFVSVEAFLDDLEAELLQLWIAQERAHWVNATHITHDTEILAAQADERVMEFMTRKAGEAKAFVGRDPSTLGEVAARKLHLIRIANPLPAPSDPERRAELARIAASMKAAYGKGEYCPPSAADGEVPCLSLGDLSEEMAKSREPERLAEIWNGWRRISVPILESYARYVSLANEGAREMGFDNLGDLWKSGYDMPPADFQAETERLWKQMEPFYKDLHCYVRGRLREVYGDAVPADGPIPAHLLGNMWGQDWTNIFDLVVPEPYAALDDPVQELKDDILDPRKIVETAEFVLVSLGLPAPPEILWERFSPFHLLGYPWARDWTDIIRGLVVFEPEMSLCHDLSRALRHKGYHPKKMVETAEAFFVSLGLPALPETFWERSMFIKPVDRDVVCHASAWDIDWKHDLRIKMCIRVNEEDFTTIHHELGHNYYQRAYLDQPALFRNSANDGFHEALGDTISLSVTPAYLWKLGLMAEEAEGTELNVLMRKALEKIAFLPFALLIDRWRWEVFAGDVPPEEYNERWWELRRRYQGIAPPQPRPADAFDPGAKYHVTANVPYTRYFLAAILQFQFHRSLCKVAGHQGPLHACSIYDSREAGKRLDEMMRLGLSRPWPEALEKITGSAEMDAGAINQYFAPLSAWLKAENDARGYTCGW